jgi:hypothetical protein
MPITFVLVIYHKHFFYFFAICHHKLSYITTKMVIKKNIEKVFSVGSKPKYKEKFSSQNKQIDSREQNAILISSLSCELLRILLS